METIDMKKLETALTYIQRMAEGNNPINNLPAEGDSVLHNPNVIRCMYFVKEVLEEVKQNNGYIGKRAPKKEKAEFPVELLATFSYREDKPISKFVEQMNEGLDDTIYKKACYRQITQWLKGNDFLREEYSQEVGKNTTMPTEKGRQIGIYAEKRSGASGIEYMRIIYNRQAQEYIVRNMEKVLNGEVAE